MRARGKAAHPIRIVHWRRQTRNPKPAAEPVLTWAERARRNNAVFCIEMAAIVGGFIGIGIAAFAVWNQWKVNEVTLEEFKEASIARNWNILTTKAPGNSGKRQALEYLASKKQSLNGIDLSCKTMGGVDILKRKNEEDEEVCNRETFLQGLDLSRNTHGHGVRLDNAVLSGTDLRDADLGGANLPLTDLSGVDLQEADLSEANLYKADLRGGPSSC